MDVGRLPLGSAEAFAGVKRSLSFGLKIAAAAVAVRWDRYIDRGHTVLMVTDMEQFHIFSVG
jgi:hypothetical protein